MYGTEGLDRRRPLVCVRCKRTFYCGEFCQERDWKERHQFECNPPHNKRVPTPPQSPGDPST
ncbi:hypothetical protein M407DRAFT_145188 [Tulasnella calospora MUT 4182]|uniref:MYND-type domain-containing protein n=1 Tax=Tulasnella calospora MUT 4182 TaxID=1051891 RepID=A0A0C3LE00_9AGAM|nr:hypothetical protein M407DRAFT_145188 [Tulasnella calospora MUT 4182]